MANNKIIMISDSYAIYERSCGMDKPTNVSYALDEKSRPILTTTGEAIDRNIESSFLFARGLTLAFDWQETEISGPVSTIPLGPPPAARIAVANDVVEFNYLDHGGLIPKNRIKNYLLGLHQVKTVRLLGCKTKEKTKTLSSEVGNVVCLGTTASIICCINFNIFEWLKNKENIEFPEDIRQSRSFSGFLCLQPTGVFKQEKYVHVDSTHICKFQNGAEIDLEDKDLGFFVYES